MLKMALKHTVSQSITGFLMHRPSDFRIPTAPGFSNIGVITFNLQTMNRQYRIEKLVEKIQKTTKELSTVRLLSGQFRYVCICI